MRWAGAVILLVLVAAAVGQTPTANPALALDGAVSASHNPPILDKPTTITVKVDNTGDADAEGAIVAVSWNDYGLMFSGWQPIEKQHTSIAAGSESTVAFEYTFPSRAHVAVQAEVSAGAIGGDANPADNHGLFNAHVIHTGADFSYHIPIANPGDIAEERTVTAKIDVRCDNGTELVECPFAVSLDADGIDEKGILVLEAEQDLMAKISADLTDVEHGEYVIVVRGIDQDTLKETFVKLRVVRTSVEDLVDEPTFCCMESLRVRVMLEKMTLLAKKAYKRGDARLAIKRLRHVIKQAIAEECHREAGEVGCLEGYMLRLVDAVRMIAVEAGAGQQTNTEKLRDGDWFRMSGLYEAATVEHDDYFSFLSTYMVGTSQTRDGTGRNAAKHPTRAVEL